MAQYMTQYLLQPERLTLVQIPLKARTNITKVFQINLGNHNVNPVEDFPVKPKLAPDPGKLGRQKHRVKTLSENQNTGIFGRHLQ